MRIILLIISFLLALMGCKPAKQQTTETGAVAEPVPFPYDLTQPSLQHKLPTDLREISGLSYYKPGKLACVQDELGVVFIYDLAQKAVVDEHVFGKNEDYEGVEYVNGTLYMLRSDGELFSMKPTDGVKIIGGNPETRQIKIDLPGKNDMEGLGYDPQLDALLLTTKDGKGTDKIIYYYSLKNNTLFQGVVLKQANFQAADPSLVEEFRPSGLAVHPQTREYYVLSSAAKRLAVLAPNGQVKTMITLDKSQFPQPEGICFSPSGTLYIASEGDGKKGVLMEFQPTN